MSEAKHTPGPWAADAVMGDYETDICLDYHVQGREFPIVIASVLFDDEDDGATREGIAEAKANARLIAATPDLYDACKMILLTAATERPELGMPLQSVRYTIGRAQLEAIKAAVAKAEGTPP